MAALLNACIEFALLAASFQVVLGDIGSDITCQACRQNRRRLANNRKSKMTAPSQECDISQNPGGVRNTIAKHHGRYSKSDQLCQDGVE